MMSKGINQLILLLKLLDSLKTLKLRQVLAFIHWIRLINSGSCLLVMSWPE